MCARAKTRTQPILNIFGTVHFQLLLFTLNVIFLARPPARRPLPRQLAILFCFSMIQAQHRSIY